MSIFIKALGMVITIIFSFGAMIEAMITMYTSVANRTVEIGTLRVLGFPRISVLGRSAVAIIYRRSHWFSLCVIHGIGIILHNKF